MIAIGVVATVVTALVAWRIQWLPDSASKEMDRIEFVFWFATIISIGIFAVVMAALLYAVWAFRVAPGDDTDGPPIHGNSRLEVAWTAIPAVLVIAIGVVTAVVLSRNADAGENPLTVKVYAQQFAWFFEYPDADDARSEELVLPVDRGVQFEMTVLRRDPLLLDPRDGAEAGPRSRHRPPRSSSRRRATGSFALVCTELCGLGHATMRAPVRVLDAGRVRDVARRAAARRTKAAEAPPTARRSSRAPAAAAATRSRRPAPTPRSARASTTSRPPPSRPARSPPRSCASRSSTRTRSLAEGYQPNVMPKTYGESLSTEEIDALVAYLTGEESP